MTCILGDCPALRVVSVIGDPSELSASVCTHRPDCVIASLGEREVKRACTEMMASHPSVRLLAVADGGRRGYLYEPASARRGQPAWSLLGELSPAALLSAARSGRVGGR